MNWIALKDIEQLDSIDKSSEERTQLLFKHSTRCNISADSYQVLDQANLDCYFLDLLQYRNISDEIAERYGVRHQSPQILAIKNGACIYNESHWRINRDDLEEIFKV